MVNLLEYEGKEIFKRYGIKIPAGDLVRSEDRFPLIKKPMVLKAQVPTGHRGKNGGVVVVKTLKEAQSALRNMQKLEFDGFSPKAFLLEDMVKHSSEVYISISLDRSNRSPMLMVSASGGVNIEDMPKEKILVFILNQMMAVPGYVKREVYDFLNLHTEIQQQFGSLIDSIWAAYKAEDAELIEINPLAISDDGLIALDSKVTIDDDALFRHNDALPDLGNNPLEAKARKEGISFVRLDGDIGLIANGAGLTMATIDQIALRGGKAGDFLDLGGTDDPEKVTKALSLVSESRPKAVLINIFGGVTKADTVAEGIATTVRLIRPKFHIFVRLSGFNAEEGKKILKKNGIMAFDNMVDAIDAAIASVKRGK